MEKTKQCQQCGAVITYQQSKAEQTRSKVAAWSKTVQALRGAYLRWKTGLLRLLPDADAGRKKRGHGKGPEKTKELPVHNRRVGPAGKAVPLSLQYLWQAEKLSGADRAAAAQ